MQSCLKYLLLACLFYITIETSIAQTVVYSSDSLVKVTSTLSNDVLLNESMADQITIEVNEEKPLSFSKLEANEFLSKYKESDKVLNKMRFESEAYCDVVPNCDKILRLPFIKAIEQLDASRYALIGYVRAKSPVFIIRHIWILDISNTPKISERILFLGNESMISFGYNLSKKEITLYQQVPLRNGIQDRGVFKLNSNGVLTDQGIIIEKFDQTRFENFLKVAKDHPHVGLGFVMYEIPSGIKIERLPTPVNTEKPIYRIQLN